MLLAAVGLSGLLASCGGSVVVGSDTPPTITSANGLYTDHRLQVAVTDADTGTVYPAGTYVVCDNLNTTVQMNVSWTGALYDLDVYATGGYYGDTHRLDTYTAEGASNDSGTVVYTFGPRAVPLSVNKGKGLTAQAITVNPIIAVDVKGQTSIVVQGNSYFGNPGNYQTVSTLNTVPNNFQLPVVDCQ